MRLWVAAYGFLFHVLALAFALWRVPRRGGADPAALAVAGATVLVAASAVYAVVVFPYVTKRKRVRGVVFFDSVVGMLAECVVLSVAALLFGAVVSSAVLRQAGAIPYLRATMESTLITMVWASSVAMTEILVIGNTAGLIGWWILKKIDERRAR